MEFVKKTMEMSVSIDQDISYSDAFNVRGVDQLGCRCRAEIVSVGLRIIMDDAWPSFLIRCPWQSLMRLLQHRESVFPTFKSDSKK